MKKMKMMKVMTALILSGMMSLSLCTGVITSMAAGDSIEITIPVKDKSAHTYDAYQIFKGDASEGTTGKVLSNIQWGSAIGDKSADFLNVLNGTDTTYNLPDTFTSKFDGKTTANAVAEVLEEEGSEFAKQFADVVAAFIDKEGIAATKSETIPANEQATADRTVTISGLSQGYYLIRDKIAATNSDEPIAYTDYILQVIGDTEVDAKEDVPSVEKKIVEGDKKLDANEAGVSEFIEYEITASLPSNFADYKEYYLEFNDTLSKGLSYNAATAELTVSVSDGTTKWPLADTEYAVTAGAYSATDGTSIKVAIGDLIQSIAKTNGAKDATITKVVLRYKVKLNKDADLSLAGNPNTVDLVFSNDPNYKSSGTTGNTPDPNEPKGKTPPSDVKTLTTGIQIIKVDENGKPLENVGFEIAPKGGTFMTEVIESAITFEVAADGKFYELLNGTFTSTAPTPETVGKYCGASTTHTEHTAATEVDSVPKYKATETRNIVTIENAYAGDKDKKTDAHGIIAWEGLGEGTYTISETSPLPGYNTISDIEITITANKDDDGNVTGWTVKAGDKVLDANALYLYELQVVNNEGITLPGTGGIGTTLFYVIGGVLVVGAGVTLITKKRMQADK